MAKPARLGITKQSLIKEYGKLPLSFETNQGQVNSKVKFMSRGGGYTLFLIATEAVLAAKSMVLPMNLLGANDKAPVSGMDELPGKINYFIGKNPATWHVNVPTCSKVVPGDLSRCGSGLLRQPGSTRVRFRRFAVGRSQFDCDSIRWRTRRDQLYG